MGLVDSQTSFDRCPFPVASMSAAGTVHRANDSWADVALDAPTAWESLGLVGSDLVDFSDTIATVATDHEPAWLDVEVNVLEQRRWSRCHVWPAANADRGTNRDNGAGDLEAGPMPDQVPDQVIVAIVPLREARTTGMSRIETEHLERILEHTADAITIVGEDMTIRFASGIATRWLGVSGTSYEGQQALSFVFRDDHAALMDAFVRCYENPRLSIKARFRAVHESGDLIWVEGIGTNMLDDPAIRGILVTLNDITELVETRTAAETNKAALEVEKARYETLAQFTPTGVFELNANNELTFRNERFQQLVGLAKTAEFSFDLFDERDQDALRASFERTRAGDTTQATVRLAHRFGGEQRWLTIRAAPQEGDRILASVEDNTSHIAKQVELEHRADHDDLTGLPNRERLLERLEELTSAGEPIAVLFLDLDKFKDINDGLGHQFGDQVLIEIAERITSVVRPNDIVGRLHGDEFLVVCRNTSDMATARDIASRVVEAVGEPLSGAPQRLFVSGSIGIAMSTPSEENSLSPEDLLVAADVAMYEAKRRGGSRSVTFNDDLGKRASDRLRLHGEVQRAASLDELELHYQPIVELTTGATAGNEALIRWHHPTQGFILPGRFIPEIEKSELIDQLGMWVIERVIADLAAQAHALDRANVNVSPRQLSDGTFAPAALALLDAHGVAGERLTVEITELVMMDDFAPVERQLHQLRERGVRVAIDDFGTGYSALAYLQRFPFDQIKIDGVFIDRIDSSESDQAIVESIINLAASLGAVAIAEKVERQSQIDELIRLGCRHGQGFLIGLPVPL